ncbi:TetR family transcriptional regulator [Caldimonas thermodepolymerans]|jgi:Transcriptional regulator|uniref:TetR family transcriptional regulator n=1 Tax=Caldimonas thermodepolymerans TaxID=215580 RepID=A0A2S5T557_9BURK|nr:TetR/AcrR family transcriptional regulator [Caldimonas thermodepolymerans]PPE70130.1 TetR family transcriptional regulator [Caldimonas thermodepolymerans]QPC32123.1 TetR family transcriptional regulator [Caldimonas thermodepolymerans]RDH98006.1 TetR family transcriptional regulator [Caldimonas thermodepolymerans]TCP08219.1 TetR family transcriptional regulator [Caldimonas thermodepolymerans]UZG48665.1 TetR/AcrR family transcriptional regulator [Caldimonas thermodepolymerans]
MPPRTAPDEARLARRTARAERRAADPAVPRERILNAAARLFRVRGFNGTPVRDIAEEVGILSGSLFHHFQSKEEILLEIMREAAYSACLQAEKIMQEESDPLRQLRALVRLELGLIVHEQRGDYHAVLFFEWRHASETAKAELTRLRARYTDCWRRALRDCEAAGLLRCEARAAGLILHGALGGAMTWFRPHGHYSAEEFGDILLRLIVA